jgi:hypothetical protein
LNKPDRMVNLTEKESENIINSGLELHPIVQQRAGTG